MHEDCQEAAAANILVGKGIAPLVGRAGQHQ
jgi:hypothetical protein